MTFDGKTVAITGASSGIGKSLAILLAKEGAKIGLVARRREKLEDIVKEITEAGGQAVAADADVTDRQAVKNAFGVIREQLGPVDVLVAGAGAAWGTKLDHSNMDKVEQVIQINLMGVIYAIEAVLPEMLERETGHLSAISSLAAYFGFPGKSAYSASKSAVNAYLQSLRIPLRKRGIAVTTICPGFVDTPMTADAEFNMPWLMSADAAAVRIAKGLRRKKKVLNFPWQTTLLVKTCSWLPDWIMAWQLKGRYGDAHVQEE